MSRLTASTVTCEQSRFNARGEDNFQKEILADSGLISKLKAWKSSEHDFSFDYDSYIYYCICSVAFRCLVSDTLNHPFGCWADSEGDLDENVRNKVWTLFLSLRKELMAEETTGIFQISAHYNHDVAMKRNDYSDQTSYQITDNSDISSFNVIHRLVDAETMHVGIGGLHFLIRLNACEASTGIKISHKGEYT